MNHTLRDQRLTRIVNHFIELNKPEIIKSGDWWYGIKNYSFNVHDFGDEGSGTFSVNVYKVDPVMGMDNYSESFDLEPVKLS